MILFRLTCICYLFPSVANDKKNKRAIQVNGYLPNRQNKRECITLSGCPYYLVRRGEWILGRQVDHKTLYPLSLHIRAPGLSVGGL